MSHELLISLILIVPLLVAGAVYLFSNIPDVREASTLLGAGTLFVLCCMMAARVAAGETVQLGEFDVALGLSFNFKLEPLGAMFAIIASGLWILNSLYSIGYMRGNRERNQTRFYICFGLALFGAMGVAMSGNLFTLFVFYEVLTLSTYPLVAHKGDENARRGARIYLLTLLGTSIGLLLMGVVWTFAIAGNLDFVEGGLLAGKVGPWLGGVLLGLFAFGVGKAALMPFHFWLPNAMVAPTPVSALLHAVAVVKAGVFSILKISVYIFGLDLLSALPGTEIIIWVGCFTIVVASMIALTKDNLKARLAYSTVSQLSYVTVGAMLANTAGATGAGLQIAMHAVAKITLFMCAGAIYVATGKTEISQMRGLGYKMPIVFTCFLIASLSIIGVPPLGGAWAKYALFQGAIEADRIYVVFVLIASTLLNIAYLLPIAILALMPPEPGSIEVAGFKRPGGAPALTVIPLSITAIGCFVLFFGVNVITDFISPVFGGRP
ncbi:MAG: cation:proton antiporter [Ponticaulis sp.]|nr:cation:proton antiporter [Ponticaulis sp.]|tara:strand:+ start:10443 stop:11921 length:1479 start_codon:yes stop_codon:yes gene_type:complete